MVDNRVTNDKRNYIFIIYDRSLNILVLPILTINLNVYYTFI